jgi:hypothetical protein
MSSSEVGWFSPSMTTVKLPSRSTFTRAPVFGSAGEPSGFPGWKSPYAESQGPGDEIALGSVNVPVGGPLFSQDEAYTAKLTVPPNTLNEEDPGDPTQSGTYKVVVTTFLDSALGPVGYDMMGYAEGPIIKVESPE